MTTRRPTSSDPRSRRSRRPGLPEPSDVLLVILSLALLLASALALGGLMAHPF